MMMMRFAGGITVAGIISFIVLEALKILMVPITAWVMALLATALKIALIAGAVLGGIAAIALGVFVYKRTKRASAEV